MDPSPFVLDTRGKLLPRVDGRGVRRPPESYTEKEKELIAETWKNVDNKTIMIATGPDLIPDFLGIYVEL